MVCSDIGYQCGVFGTGSTFVDERQMDAMVGAVSPQLNGAGGCSELFLRDDAVLVVTFITDEADKSVAGPASWKSSLVDAKNGDENAIVVLGLFGDNDQPDGMCHSFFLDAVSIIGSACDEFVPVG